MANLKYSKIRNNLLKKSLKRYVLLYYSTLLNLRFLKQMQYEKVIKEQDHSLLMAGFF